VLDSCHSGGANRGNLTIRSRAGGSGLTMSETELASIKPTGFRA